MKIVVLNGSPKGQISVTMQYVAYLRQQFPQHEFVVLDVAQKVGELEQDEAAFAAVMAEVAAAGAVLWAFPLYYYLVHAGYKRFIELIFERGAGRFFHGKHAAMLTTSIHFFDHTAHNYIHGICEDLGMKVYGGYSAEMEDLFKDAERTRLELFFAGFTGAAAQDVPTPRVYPPLVWRQPGYLPGPAVDAVDPADRKIVIVSDAGGQDGNLAAMTGRLAAAFSGKAKVINLRQLDIKGNCQGCLRCAYDNTCLYQDRDGLIDFYRNELQRADIIVFAGTIRDRYLSALWKTFFDRSFFNTHVPMFTGKQMAFLISGPLGQLANLRQILEAHVELQFANLAGIVTDEYDDAASLDRLLDQLAANCVEYARLGYVKPRTFYQVSGVKIFRDEIWGRLRFPFVADHESYKRNKRYDFPQYDYKTRLRNFMMGLLVRIPSVRREIYGAKMKDHMIAPFAKVLKKR